MKKILLFLLLSIAGYGQVSTGQEQDFPYGIINSATQTVTNPNTLVTQGADGTYGKASVNNIPISIPVQDSLNKKLNLPTGFLQGLQLSINVDPTKFNIASGYYVVTDFSTLTQPVVKIISYAGATGLSPAYLLTANSTYVALDINGTLVSSASPFTDAQRRTLALVGNVVHPNHTTINNTNEIKAPIVAIGNQLHDFMKAIGFLNENGNIYSPNGANLMLNKSSGDIFGMGINSADYLNPHKLTIPAQTALTFAYRFQNGVQTADTQNINPNIYDVGGVSTAVPVGSRWTVQRINLFQSGIARIQPGQTVYTSFNDAVMSLPTQSFVTEQNIADNAVFRCYLIVQQGTTNLASAVAGGTAQFVPVDKFGNIIGNGSVALTYSNIVAALGYTPANDADVVKLTGGQTIAGLKNFTTGLVNSDPVLTDKAVTVDNGVLKLSSGAIEDQLSILASNITADRSVEFPDDSGTVALTKLTVRKISTNTTLSNTDNGTIILLTASCTVTLPNGLMGGFNCSFSTQTGVTMTYALGGSVVLINNTGTTMAEKLSHTIVNTGVSNEYLTAGSL